VSVGEEELPEPIIFVVQKFIKDLVYFLLKVLLLTFIYMYLESFNWKTNEANLYHKNILSHWELNEGDKSQSYEMNFDKVYFLVYIIFFLYFIKKF